MQSALLLYIDDSATSRLLLRAMVETYGPPGWVARGVPDLPQAAMVLQHEAVSALLLDLHLTEVSGLETIRAVYVMLQTVLPLTWQHLPLIILTGGDKSLAPQALSLGAMAFVSKDAMVDDPGAFFAFLQQTLGDHACGR